MAIFVSGINHSTAPVEIREKLSFSDEQAKIGVQRLLQERFLEAAVILSTCNRTEVYGIVRDNSDLNGQIPSHFSKIKNLNYDLPPNLFYRKDNRNAVKHLFKVAAGLDSMVIGEAQILGQVKQAYALATQVKTTDTVLNKLFHHSFRIGKRVRSESKIGEGLVSVGSVAVNLAKKIYHNFSDKKIVLIGAGEMALQTLTQLKSEASQKIFILNRTFEKAKALAEKVGGDALSYQSLPDAIELADILITSTSAKEPIIVPELVSKAMASRKHRPLFLIDIAVPRNIHTDVKKIYNTYLYDIDDLKDIVTQNLGERKKEIPRAERIIAEELDKFMEWYDSLSTINTIKQLQKHFENIRLAEVKRNRKYFMKEDWDQMDKFSQSLVKKFLHSPIMRLKSCSETRNNCQHCTVKDVFGMEDGCLTND